MVHKEAKHLLWQTAIKKNTPTSNGYAVFSCYPWESCSFLKGNEGGIDLEQRGVGSSGGRGNYAQDIIMGEFKKEKYSFSCM